VFSTADLAHASGVGRHVWAAEVGRRHLFDPALPSAQAERIEQSVGVEDLWRPGETWRSLDLRELALLEELTATKFEGAPVLRAQIPFTTAQQGCGCGCGTLNLNVDESRAPPIESTHGRSMLVEADVRSAAGGWDGGLILFVSDGYLRCLEIYTWRDEPLPLPQVQDIRTRLPERPESPAQERVSPRPTHRRTGSGMLGA
jgi:hypothetical protein